MTTTLVCEGTCNPNIDTLDAAVRDERQARRDDNAACGYHYRVAGPLPDPLLRMVSRLVHTPHRKVAPHVYACAVCGGQRKF